MKIWVVMAKVEELQARSVDKVFNSKEKAEQYSEDQNQKEITQLLNIGGIDRSIEEWDVE
ncbi:MAG TPA: hypothetical protein VFY64_11825 [Nitrososphaeraceae archaeon]|nr:hypothetical protein [Nitrososphaeraceae archaeon]